jgi:hypothetical protein
VLEQKTNTNKNKQKQTQTQTQTHKHKCKDYYLLLNYEFFSHLSHLSLVCAAFFLHDVLNRLTSTSTAAAAAEVVVACIAREFHFFVIEVSVEVCSVVKSFIAR